MLTRFMIRLQLFCVLSFIASFSFAQQNALCLMSYNVRNAKGMDNKVDYERVSVIIKNSGADVVALQELDSVTKRSNGDDVIKILAGQANYFYVFGAAISFQGGKYGVGVLSRGKPLMHYTIPLPGREEQRVLLVAEFKSFVIFCTHLSLTAADREQSLAIINREMTKFSKPVYLLGDLNAEPSSDVIAGLKQSWNLLSGEEPGFPSPLPVKCIDYIFVNRKVIVPLSHTVLNEPVASDHRPLLVKVKGTDHKDYN